MIALGLLYGTSDPADKDTIHSCLRLAGDFHSRVEQELGSSRCGDIMERQLGRRFDLRDPAQRQEYAEAGGGLKCTAVVQAAVKIANELLQEMPMRNLD